MAHGKVALTSATFAVTKKKNILKSVCSSDVLRRNKYQCVTLSEPLHLYLFSKSKNQQRWILFASEIFVRITVKTHPDGSCGVIQASKQGLGEITGQLWVFGACVNRLQ